MGELHIHRSKLVGFEKLFGWGLVLIQFHGAFPVQKAVSSATLELESTSNQQCDNGNILGLPCHRLLYPII